ncbi:MAG: PAS domain S-box protein [Syntrophobacteraceae bacterium]
MLRLLGTLLFGCYLSFFAFTLPGESYPAAVAAEITQKHVRIGVLARRGAEECLSSWWPMAAYLESYISGIQFEIVPLSFEQIVPSVQANELDFIIANSSVYVEIQALFGVTRIATMKDSTRDPAVTLFGGVVFCRADRTDIASFEDLKGKSFMAVDETSFGGWRAAWRELKEHGIDPHHNFRELLFGGTHDAVALAVRDGKVDAGTVATPILEQMTKEGKLQPGLFKVINPREHFDFPYVHSTRLYPKWPFAKLKYTSNALAEKVAIALLAMPTGNPGGQPAGYTGWTVPLDYASVEECLRYLRVGIYRDFGKISFEAVLSYYRWHILFAFCAISGLAGLLFLSMRLNHGLRSSKLALQAEVMERKLAEEALSRISHQQELILMAAGEGILGLDPEGNITFINPAAAQMMGWNQPDLIGKPHHETAHHTKADGSVYAREECPIHDSLRNGCIRKAPEELFWRKDGTSFPVEYQSTPIVEEGEPPGVVITFRDITDQKRAEKTILENEKKFRMFYEQAPLGYQSLDAEGRFIDVNHAWLDFFGYTKKEVVGRRFGDFMTENSREHFAKGFPRFKEIGKVHGAEFEMIRKDRPPAIVAFHGSIGRDDHGRFKQTHCIMQDITEQKRAEEERVRLVTAFNQAAEAIFVTDANWVIQYVNPAFERLTGYCDNEIIGQGIRILRSFKHSNDFYYRMGDTLNKGKVWSGRIVNRKKDGTLYEAEATASPVRDKSGAVINYVSIHRDITNEVRLERELRQAQKMEAIGTLAGGIAHDFNNILGIIIGYTELALLKSSDPAGVQQNLRQVKEAGQRAADLVKQILTFSRRSGQERKAMEIIPTVKEALKLLRSSLPATIEIRQEIAINPGKDIVLSNPTHIHQILMNLCANSAHAMRAKGGILGVKLWSTMTDASLISRHPDLKVGQYVCITVSDTGHGMSDAVMERIFDPYFTTKGPGDGTGLGLSVIQGIVKSHGGAISVYSEPGLGTTFHIFLPGTAEEIQPGSKAVEVSLPSGTEHILFVDDERDLVDTGKDILEFLGYRVTGKTDGLEALEIFRTKPDDFDLVITDMTMPHLTGSELATQMMALRPNIPVILCSGFNQQLNEKSAREAGIREFVMKPYTVTTLAMTIRKCIEEK